MNFEKVMIFELVSSQVTLLVSLISLHVQRERERERERMCA